MELPLSDNTKPVRSNTPYQTAVVPYGVFERTGLVLSAGQNIVASTTGTAVNVNVYGIETSTT